MNKLWSGPYLLVWFQLPPQPMYPLYSWQIIIVISEIPKGHPLIFDKGYFPISILSLRESLFILQMPYLFLHFYSQKHLVHSSIIAFSLLIEIICLAVYLPNKALGCHVRLLNLTARKPQWLTAALLGMDLPWMPAPSKWFLSSSGCLDTFWKSLLYQRSISPDI